MAEVNLKIEQYEGPLDLLLALISKHKIDIFDIPIAEICDQYNAYLDSMQKLDMEVAGEFIVMAAELMLIKSRMLLPMPEDGEDPRKVLVDALLEHQRAKQTAEYLKKQADTYFDRFTKPAEEQTDPTYHREHAVSLLQEAFDRITLRLEAERAQKAEVKLFKTLQEERFYTVEEKMDLLTETLRRVPRITFDSLFTDVHSRGEVVAIFLSVLEAVRFGFVDVFRENEDTLWLSLVKE
ncbi:MAG: segregation/condensation protein A [Clostridia bacterium]|nr:segregation/condensation protein A [Clostridia bacterium]MBO7157368.1 segregation/condensation protein A [Clostridia bacterium]